MRLLIVEDYSPLRRSLIRGLEKAGFAVDATGDGTEGLWFARSNDYDVIVLDIMLPGTDGLQILDALRSAGDQTHVLLLTARDTIEDRVTGLDHGADDYLVKPFAFAELLARVRALVRRGYQAKNPRVTIADLTLDLAHQSVQRGTREIILTPREYALLEYFALSGGRVISRIELSEHLWSHDWEKMSNVLDVHVANLRKKIDQGRPESLLRTVRGAGYALRM